MIKKHNLQLKDNKNFIKNQSNNLTKAKLVNYLEKGLDLEDAAKLCKISSYQLSVFRSDPEFEDFVKECQIRFEESNLDNIKDAGDAGAYKASQWLLERKFPDKYGKKDTIKHEYEIKLNSFVRLIFNVINALDPFIRQTFMQKLRELDMDGEIIQMKQSDKLLEYEPEKMKEALG